MTPHDPLTEQIDALRDREARLRALLLAADHRPAANGKAPTTRESYRRTADRVREVLAAVVPAGGTVLVVSKGDDALLRVDGRRGWHFPRTPDGTYAGHHPADTADVLARLEAARAAGATHLAFPQTAFWWLDHYPGLRAHLDGHCRKAHADEHCVVYALAEPPDGRVADLERQVAALAAEVAALRAEVRVSPPARGLLGRLFGRKRGSR